MGESPKFAGLLGLLLLYLAPAYSQGIIMTVAGNGAPMYAGDGGVATSASLNHPRGLAVDASGALYIADTDNSRVRKITANGMITTIAGNGVLGDPNTALSDVIGLAVDAAGNVYIADAGNRKIKKVTPGGVITTIAGTGVQGYSGDNGAATAAMLNRPTSIAVDVNNNLYIADSSNHRIRKIAANGTITTYAGNGVEAYSGDGGFATGASLAFPLGVAVDRQGNVFVADGNNNRIRKITPQGVINTVAGNGRGAYAGDNGLAVNASLNIPSDVAVDAAGNLFIADAGNNRVRKVDAFGNIITTIAGTGTDGFSGDNGVATSAMLNHPWGVTVDAGGAVYVADRINNRVRKISPQAALGPPTLPESSAVNGASFAKGMPLAAGSIVSIFGSNLADTTASATTTPLPTTLGNATVMINNIPAPLFAVTPGQINLQVPFEVGMGNASFQVRRGGVVSEVRSATIGQVSPGIFIMDQNTSAGAILHADNYALVNNSAPARPGEYLLIYATGLGPLRIPVRNGERAPSAPPFAETTLRPVVMIAGIPANVIYSGLAPGLVGLYQLNVQVPATLPPGNAPVQININGVTSNIATVAVTR